MWFKCGQKQPKFHPPTQRIFSRLMLFKVAQLCGKPPNLATLRRPCQHSFTHVTECERYGESLGSSVSFREKRRGSATKNTSAQAGCRS